MSKMRTVSKVKQSKEVAESMTRRESAMTDLFIAVMNGYEYCPPKVKAAWQTANKESNNCFYVLRNAIEDEVDEEEVRAIANMVADDARHGGNGVDDSEAYTYTREV